MHKAEQLLVELCQIKAHGDILLSERAEEIRKELNRLAKQRAKARARRELLYDINGHHGPA